MRKFACRMHAFWLCSALISVQPAWSASAQTSSAARNGGGSTVQIMAGKRALTREQYDAYLRFQEAYKLLQAQDWTAADAKLQEAIKLDPACQPAYVNRANVLLHLGRKDEALASANEAMKLEPGDIGSMASKAAACESLGQLDVAYDLYQTILRKFPTHPRATEMRNHSKLLHEALVQQQGVLKEHKETGDADNYFEFATYDAVAKWTPDKFPLKVYVLNDAEAAKIDGYKPEFGAAVRAAFEDWQQRTNNVVSFDFVDSPAKANITCGWTSDPSKVRKPGEGGDTQVFFNDTRGISRADIAILTKLPSQIAAEPSFNRIKAIGLHEIGHSLGLLGHSPTPTDIMFAAAQVADSPPSLTDRDVKTLLHLYSPEVQMVSHLHDAQGGKDGLNNVGAELARKGDYTNALAKFESGLKLDPNYMPLKFNLSLCLNQMAVVAVKEHRYQDALTYLQKARALQNGIGNAEAQATILRNLKLVYSALNKDSEAHAIQSSLDSLGNAASAPPSTGVRKD